MFPRLILELFLVMHSPGAAPPPLPAAAHAPPAVAPGPRPPKKPPEKRPEEATWSDIKSRLGRPR